MVLSFVFLNPLAFWALPFLLVPVIIHLFSFKKFKKLEFSNVDLLKNIHHSGVAKRNLQSLLVLLVRLLMLSFIIICFAQPVEGKDEGSKKAKKIISIYLDDSFSMGAIDNQLDLLSNAKYVAEQIVNQYSINDRFQIISNTSSLKSVKLLQQAEAKEKITELRLNAVSKPINKVYQRQLQLMEGVKNFDEYDREIYWLSDMQSFLDTSFLRYNSTSIYGVVFSPQQENNLVIDSVWFESPIRNLTGAIEELSVRIANTSDLNFENKNVKLNVNGKKYFVDVDLPASTEKEFLIPFVVPDSSVVEAEITLEDGAVTFDNSYFFSYKLPKKIRVLLVSSNEELVVVVNKIFKNDSSIVCQSILPSLLTSDVLGTSDLVILGELASVKEGVADLVKNYLNQQKALMVIPSNDIDIDSYNFFANKISGITYSKLDTTSIELAEVDPSSFFFRTVFDLKNKVSDRRKIQMPIISRHYTLLKKGGGFEPVLKKVNGEVYAYKSDNVLYLASPLSKKGSDFSTHPLIVPVFFQAVFQSVLTNDLAYTIGNSGLISLGPLEDAPYELKDNKGFSLVLSDVEKGKDGVVALNKRLNFQFNAVQKSGWYYLYDANQQKLPIALNYDRAESKRITNQVKLIKDYSKTNKLLKVVEVNDTIDSALKEIVKGKEYWKYFLMGAILFLAIEMLLIRFFVLKNKSV